MTHRFSLKRLIVFIILPALVAAVCLLLFQGQSGINKASGDTTTLNPSRDARINSGAPDTNYGSANPILISATLNRALMRFDTSAIPAGSTINSVALKLYPTVSGTAGGVEVHPSSNSWAENTVTWNTQPTWNTTVLATSATPVANTWLTTTLPTSAVTAGADTFFGLRYSATGFNFTFASKEDPTNKPELLVDFTPPTQNVTVNPSGDTYVAASAPTTNFGNANPIQVSNSNNTGFLKFDTSGIPSGATVNSVTLRLFSTAALASGGTEFHPLQDTWNEGTATYANTLGVGGTVTWDPAVLATSGTPALNAWLETTLPASAVTKAGNTNLGLKYNTTGVVAKFASKEDVTNKPQLVVSYSTGQPPPPPPGETVLWAVGDMCDDDNTPTPDCAAVGDMINADTDADVFLGLGDLQYENGELVNFNTYYKPKVHDKISDITKPVPGNHEYNTAGAVGYYSFFGTNYGDAGDPTKGYYALTVGNWRIIGTNSNCTPAGGCSSTSPQGSFIRAQLDAARTAGQCQLGFDHHPGWSDGSNYGGGTSTGKELFNHFYDYTAELFLSGHEHNYQRFTQLNKSYAADSNGVRQMVVGSGGKNLTTLGTPSSINQYQQASKFGAIRLVLTNTGYTGEFRAVDGTVMDTFSGTCR